MKLKKFIQLFFLRFFPPLWLWMRSSAIIITGIIIYLFIDKIAGKIFLFLPIIHLFAYSLTQICKTMERKMFLFFKPIQKGNIKLKKIGKASRKKRS